MKAYLRNLHARWITRKYPDLIDKIIEQAVRLRWHLWQRDGEWTPKQAREINAWLETEPGMTDRLERRKAQLARLEALEAPEIILAEQRRMVREIEEKLNS